MPFIASARDAAAAVRTRSRATGAPSHRRAAAGRGGHGSHRLADIGFLTTALIANLRRGGKPLRDDLAGIWPARRGTYRLLYRINDDPREVVVLRIEHRRDAYRPL